MARNVDVDGEIIPIPSPGPIDPRRDQTDSGQRLDHMNDIMRLMRVEMEKREMAEARRVSESVERVGRVR